MFSQISVNCALADRLSIVKMISTGTLSLYGFAKMSMFFLILFQVILSFSQVEEEEERNGNSFKYKYPFLFSSYSKLFSHFQG